MNLRASILCFAMAAAGSAQAADSVGIQFFESKIRPVLAAQCYDCHGVKKSKGGLRLDERAGWQKGGDTGPAIVPGKPDESLVIQSIRHESADLKMPAKAPKLDARVIADFVTWIKMGAPDPRDAPDARKGGESRSWADLLRERSTWWCFQPLAPRPGHAPTGSAVIDELISAKLRDAGLAAAPRADRRTLIRRLTFALTGLPPTPEEVEAFVADAAPQAWERLVDRLLASPHFGEHWARHWMDVIHYSETNGSEFDPLIPFAYRYRDYLVRAFNADLPYDQLIREHLAGDLLTPPRWNRELGLNESLLGTGFWRFVEFYHTPVDVKLEMGSTIDQQIDVVSKAFQGLTMSCARCHIHKFDPISNEDYYALYGIIDGTRQGIRIVDDEAPFVRHNAELAALRSRLKPVLAAEWLASSAEWPRQISAARGWLLAHRPPPLPAQPDAAKEKELEAGLPTDPWTRALFHAARSKPVSALAPLAALALADDDAFAATWKSTAEQQLTLLQRAAALPPGTAVIADFRDGGLAGWTATGVGLPKSGVTAAGELAVAAEGSTAVRGVLERGYHSDAVSDRHGGSFRSPEFILSGDVVDVLARGSGSARLRLVIENFQGGQILFEPINVTLNNAALSWQRLPIRETWKGLRAYVELVARDDRAYLGNFKDPQQLEKSNGRSGFGVSLVAMHPENVRLADLPSLPASFWSSQPHNFQECAAALRDATTGALERWRDGRCDDAEARLLSVSIEAGVLGQEWERDPGASALVADYRKLENTIPVARRAPGVFEDSCGRDGALFTRGDYHNADHPVPRRFLEVLGSDPSAYAGPASGRRQLADEIASPRNPLTARVMANRVWHWLCGRGIVGTVDNFGRMGELPTHPELLDELAREFVESGWSVKSLIRTIVLSETWQRASAPPPHAGDVDPGNRLWSHAEVQRLEAESIRDSLLAVAGNLRSSSSGPGSFVYYKEAIDPDKQPVAGPIDGDQRRSIFLEVRRDFLSDFLLAFDFPKPTATAGRRSQTNVPAQSLALLNDPFVKYEAAEWSKRVLAAEALPAARVRRMYEEAFGRQPAAKEEAAALAFTAGAKDDAAAWADLAHAFFNMKEMIYLK
jgi:hypothetical protein